MACTQQPSISTLAYDHIIKLTPMFGLNKDNVQGQVGELTERLKSGANLTDEQAQKVLETIKEFVVEKYPMLSGAVDSMFGGK
jgi:hypothetical protein